MSEDIVYTFKYNKGNHIERKMGMPWKEKSVELMREEFVKRVLSKEKSKSELCREYGISRPTGDKWLKRFLQEESLSDRSRTPFRTANKTPAETEQFIVEYRKKYPAIGAVKIHSDSQLFQSGNTVRTSGTSSGIIQCRQEHSCKNCNNCNHHQ